MSEDGRLLDACARGEQQAWRTLIDKYGRLVYSIPRRYGLAAADADDVFQAVFAGLHRGLSGIQQPGRLSAWLITAAHRESLRSKARRATPGNPADAPDENTPLPPEQILLWERQHELHAGLARLGPPCSDLLRMLFFDARAATYEQVAARLGLPVGSIGPTRTRCFEKLREILRQAGIFEADDPGDETS